MSGNSCVGGIVGKGKEVTDCYAFVDIKYFIEKAGAIIGITDSLPDGTEDIILGNYYFNAGKEAGGIDGITYTGNTDEVDVATFLQLPNLSDLLRTVTLRFIMEGKEDVVLTLSVGESLKMDQIPQVSVDTASEYEWELVPAVTEEVLDMGEVGKIEYLSEESITNILFDQNYKVSLDLKDTVISSIQRNDKNLSIALAEGTFTKNTTFELEELLFDDLIENGKVIDSKKILLSNTGVNKVHYLIPDKLEVKNVKLYIQDVTGGWEERDYVVEGSYLVFEFTDGEIGFALQEMQNDYQMEILGTAIVLLIIVVSVIVVMRIKKRKNRNGAYTEKS